MFLNKQWKRFKAIFMNPIIITLLCLSLTAPVWAETELPVGLFLKGFSNSDK